MRVGQEGSRESFLKSIFGNKKRLAVLGQVARHAAENPGEPFSQVSIEAELRERGQMVAQGEVSAQFIILENHGLVDVSRAYADREAQFTLRGGEAHEEFWSAMHKLIEAIDGLYPPPDA